jgi:hypothetical protein
MIAWLLLLLTMQAGAPAQDAAADERIEVWISVLLKVSEQGLGYSVTQSGVGFLPLSGAQEVQRLLLGAPPPEPSEVLRRIVEQGAIAVPMLLRHLEDDRPTGLDPVRGRRWISFDDEYDFNRRSTPKPPEGVNRETFGEKRPDHHQVTVGDLCFVALGQIVNRRYSAIRFQPRDGIVVNSPTYSKRLREAARREWGGLTAARHREGLLQELLTPDFEARRIGAYYRLAYYYPEALEEAVLGVLGVPTFDIYLAERFVRQTLYKTDDAAKRKELLRKQVQDFGAPAADGVLLQLYTDLRIQEGLESGAISEATYVKDEPRRLLIELFARPSTVKSAERPYLSSWCTTDMGNFIAAAVHDRSRKVDERVHAILLGIQEDDILALGCMNRLLGRGFDDAIAAYCRRRIESSKYHADELRAMLNKLKK